MTSIAGHIIFPHNGWSTGQRLKWSRKWETELGVAISGQEQRAALRAWPRHKLTCGLLAESLQERCRLDARVDAALKSGYACAPFFGRGCPLAAAAGNGADALTIVSPANWPWAAGDYTILLRDDTSYDVLSVSSVAGSILNLAGVLACSWGVGSFVHPLLFGKFSCDTQTPLTNWHGGSIITIEQLAAERTAQLGATPAHIPGIGEMRIEGEPPFEVG